MVAEDSSRLRLPELVSPGAASAMAAAPTKGAPTAVVIDKGKGPGSPPTESSSLVPKKGGETEAHHHTRSKWYQSSFILMAEIMGAGILGLPFAMSRLGWVWGLITSVLGGILCTYSGVLLSRAKHELGQDQAESYADLAYATGGRVFGDIVRGIVYLSWVAVLPYFLLACVDSLRDLFPTVVMPVWQWALVVCAFLLPSLQLRTLHQISYLALPSTIAVVAAVGLVLASLLSSPMPAGATHSVWIPPATRRSNVVGHVSSFVFAYMGHSMYFEVMREMERSAEFSKALIVSNAIMGTCYTATSVLAYQAAGSGVAGFLPDSMPAGVPKQAVGLLLAFHTAVSYLVQGQPLHRAMQRWAFPRSVDKTSWYDPPPHPPSPPVTPRHLPSPAPSPAATPPPQPSPPPYLPPHRPITRIAPSPPGNLSPSKRRRRAALDWFVCTGALLVSSAIVAVAIPFFSDLQQLLGSFLGAPLVFGCPAFFFLASSRAVGKPIATVDLVLCGLFLYILSPLFAIVGTATSLVQIHDSWVANPNPEHYGLLLTALL